MVIKFHGGHKNRFGKGVGSRGNQIGVVIGPNTHLHIMSLKTGKKWTSYIMNGPIRKIVRFKK